LSKKETNYFNFQCHNNNDIFFQLYTKLILIALSSSKYTIIYDNGISIKGRITEGVGGITDGWFGECVVRKVGDEIDTLFWTDPWLGGLSLCERFSRLFDLAMT
jgi:hypothetical protein